MSDLASTTATAAAPKRTLQIVLASLTLAAVACLGGCGDGEGGPAADEQPATVESAPDPPRDDRARPSDPLPRAETLVFIGDSLATAGPDPYPGRLDALVSRPLAVTNLAQAGTTSADWLPGRPLFEDRLRPLLADADAVFVSVGGTDLERALLGSSGPDALEQADDAEGVAAIEAAFGRIERNLARTFAAIEDVNPRTAIVFVGYPDYSASAVWQERGGELGAVALRAGLGAFESITRGAGADETIEMLAVTTPEIDSLLSDGEHLGDAGHQLYAEQIADRLEP